MSHDDSTTGSCRRSYVPTTLREGAGRRADVVVSGGRPDRNAGQATSVQSWQGLHSIKGVVMTYRQLAWALGTVLVAATVPVPASAEPPVKCLTNTPKKQVLVPCDLLNAGANFPPGYRCPPPLEQYPKDVADWCGEGPGLGATPPGAAPPTSPTTPTSPTSPTSPTKPASPSTTTSQSSPSPSPTPRPSSPTPGQ
jgi:hypothetical protein